MMKIEDLRKELLSHKVPKDAYSLANGLPNEAFCIGFVNGVWEVYYSERGNKTGIRYFAKEPEACEYFLSWILDVLKDMSIID